MCMWVADAGMIVAVIDVLLRSAVSAIIPSLDYVARGILFLRGTARWAVARQITGTPCHDLAPNISTLPKPATIDNGYQGARLRNPAPYGARFAKVC